MPPLTAIVSALCFRNLFYAIMSLAILYTLTLNLFHVVLSNFVCPCDSLVALISVDSTLSFSCHSVYMSVGTTH
jgi:hypothetical protein